MTRSIGKWKLPQPTDIKEELRKINAKLSKEKKQRVEENLSNKINVKVTDKNKPDKNISNLKRKKSFWDPDSDSEYDKLVKRHSTTNVQSTASSLTSTTEKNKSIKAFH